MQTAEQYLVTPQTSEQLNRDAAALARSAEESVHELEVRRARYYLTPSIVQLLVYFLLSTIILVGLNFQVILKGLNQQLAFDDTLAQSVQQQLSQYADNQFVGTITLVLFWGLVGLGVYTLYWLVMAFITAARNELIVETAFSNRGHFWEKVKVPMIKLTFLGCIAGFILLLLRVIVPVLSDLFARGITNLFTSSVPIAALEFAATTLILMVALHILVALAQIFRHADGIF